MGSHKQTDRRVEEADQKSACTLVGLEFGNLLHGVVVVHADEHVIGTTDNPLLARDEPGRTHCARPPPACGTALLFGSLISLLSREKRSIAEGSSKSSE